MSNHCEDRGIVHFSNILCENKTVRAGEGMVGFINLVKSLTGTTVCLHSSSDKALHKHPLKLFFP